MADSTQHLSEAIADLGELVIRLLRQVNEAYSEIGELWEEISEIRAFLELPARETEK